MTGKMILLFSAVAALFLPRVAHADPITLAGNGTLEMVVCTDCFEQIFGFTPLRGDPFTFSFSLPSTPVESLVQPPDFHFRSYGNRPITVTLGTHNVEFQGWIFASLYNNFFRGDELSFTMEGDVPSVGRVSLGIIATDPTNQWLNSVEWPADLAGTLNLAPSAEMTFGLDLEEGPHNFARGPIANFSSDASPAPIPEPASLVLFGTGLVGIAIRRACNKRQGREI
jgi:PEP-CTERM motif